MNRLHRLGLGFVVAVAFFMVSGCGSDGLKLTKATGKVTFNGNPISGATVTFMFEDGNLSSGITDNEGKFKLVSNAREGAFTGKAKISVTKFNSGRAGVTPETAKPEDMFKGFDAKNSDAMKKQAKPTNELPDRYNSTETSGLSEEVQKSGPNDFTITLVGDSK